MRGCKWKNNIWLKVAGNIYHDQARPGGGGPGGHVPPPARGWVKIWDPWQYPLGALHLVFLPSSLPQISVTERP